MKDPAQSRCPILLRLWKSTIGRKYLVAITGLALVVFLAGHLAGNLLVFAGPEAFNDYADLLRNALHGAGLWAARFGLLAAFIIHVAATVSLSRQNRAAREQYEKKDTIQASRSSRIMIWSGLTIFAFVIYHLLHFTLKWGNDYDTSPRYQEQTFADGSMVTRHDAWQMVVDGFSVWYVVLFYILAMTLLCSHLSHGVQSMFQTLGWRSRKSAPLLNAVSRGYALLIWTGFVSIPVSILIFGFGR